MRGLTSHSRGGALISLTAVILAVSLVSGAWLVSGSLTVVAIALPAGVALIVNTVTMRVRHHAEVLALYRAVGATKRALSRDIIFRSFWVGGLGSLAGTLLSLLVATPGGFGREEWPAIPVAVVMGLAVTMGTAVIASWRVMTRPTTETLRHKEPEARTQVAAVIGAAVTAAGIAGVLAHPGGYLSTLDRAVSLAGVLLIWLGVILAAPVLSMLVLRPVGWILGVYGGPVYRLAVREALRHPRRTAMTASSLITGICLVCAFAASGTLLGLVLAVAVFDVARTFVLSGVDRGRDIEVMRSVGASRPFVLRTVRRENVLIAACASTLGLAAGLVLGSAMQHVMRNQSFAELTLSVPALLLMLAILATIGAAALWLPTHRAASADIPHLARDRHNDAV